MTVHFSAHIEILLRGSGKSRYPGWWASPWAPACTMFRASMGFRSHSMNR